MAAKESKCGKKANTNKEDQRRPDYNSSWYVGRYGPALANFDDFSKY